METFLADETLKVLIGSRGFNTPNTLVNAMKLQLLRIGLLTRQLLLLSLTLGLLRFIEYKDISGDRNNLQVLLLAKTFHRAK